MGTVDNVRQYLSAYRAAIIGGVIGAALVTTAGVTVDRSPPPRPRIVSDGHTVTLPPVTLPPVTATTTVTAMPTQALGPSETSGPSVLPSQLPSSVPPSISPFTPTLSATPTLTPSPTLTPRNHANGLKPPVCIIAIDHNGEVIKRPCKEAP